MERRKKCGVRLDVLGHADSTLSEVQEFVVKHIDHLFAYTYFRLDYFLSRTVCIAWEANETRNGGCHSLTQASSHVWWIPEKRPIIFGAVMSGDGIGVKGA